MGDLVPFRRRYDETVARATVTRDDCAAVLDAPRESRDTSPNDDALTANGGRICEKHRAASTADNRNAALDSLAAELVPALALVFAGHCRVLTVAVNSASDLAWWHPHHALLIPATSARGRRHAHGLLVALDSDDAEDALRNYTAAVGVPLGACELSPPRGAVHGWRVPARLRSNVYRIVSYATDEQRQGPIDFGGSVAFGVFRRPWDRFLTSGAPSLWQTAITSPCLSCGQLVSGRKITCSAACRQKAYRERYRSAASSTAVTVER
jgi:hypothetical protein